MTTKPNFRILLPLATLSCFFSWSGGGAWAQEAPAPVARTGASTGATDERNIDDCIRLYNQRSYKEAEAACRAAVDAARGRYRGALAHYDLGVVLYAEDRFEDAVKEYDQANTKWAGESDTHFARGVALYRLNRKDEAMQDYNRAIFLGCEKATAFLDRGVAWYDRGVAAQDEAERAADFRRADKDFTQAIHMNPSYANAYVNRASERRAANQPEAAQKDYDMALKLNPSDSSAYYNRATLLYKDGKLEQSAKDFGDSIRLDPNFGTAYYDLGVVYTQMAQGNAEQQKSDLDKASQNFRMAVKTDEKSKDAYFNLAEVEFQQGQYQDAANDYTQALKLNGDWGDALTGRALAYEKLKPEQWQAAIDDLLKVKPATAKAHYALGVAYSGENHFGKAVEEYKLALAGPEATPDAKEKLDVAEIYYGMGVAHHSDGKTNEAIEDYTNALSRKPDYEDALRQRGEAYDDAKNWAAALADLEKARSLNPNDPGVLDALGRAYLGKQDYPNALASFNKEVALKPTPDAHVDLGVAYYASGDAQTAIKHFNDALAPEMDNKEPWVAYLDRSTAKRRLALGGADADLERGLSLAPPEAKAKYEAEMNPDFLRLAREGHADYEKHDYAGAYNAYSGAVHDSASNPKEAWEAYYGKGISEFESEPKKLADAIADLNKALELRHDPYPAVHNALGAALREQGIAANDASQLAAAENEFRKAREQSKADQARFDEASENLAETLLAEKKWTEAVAAYQEIKAKQNDAVVWAGSGLALYHIGRWQESVNDFNAAIHLYLQKNGASEDVASAYVGLGNSYSQMDQWREAVNAYQEAAARKPGDAAIQMDLGFAKAALNGKPGAMRDYRRALAAERKKNGTADGRPYYDLADVEVRNHHLTAALQDARQAVRLSKGTNPDAYDLRGVVEGDLHSYAAARNDFRTALNVKQDDLDIHFNHAMALIPNGNIAHRVRRQRWEEVRGELRTVLDKHSEDAEAHFYSGLADLYLGSHDAKGRAKKDFDETEYQNALNDFKVAAQSPQYAKQAYLHLADLHRYKDDMGAAQGDFNHAVAASNGPADASSRRRR